MILTVRNATGQDAPAIVALVQELAGEGREDSPIDEGYVGDYQAAGGNILVAEVDGEVIGLLSFSARPNLYHAGDCYLIEELVVTAAQRSHGAGRALVAELVDLAEQSGYAEISVSTLMDNTRAIRFYQELGFTDEGLLLERHKS